MTIAKPVAPPRATGKVDPPVELPDPPRAPDMQQYVHIANVASTLMAHFASRPGTLISGEGFLCYDTRSHDGWLVPDCVVAFDVDPESITDRNGYVIGEVGKPPDFVLEVASRRTGQADYTRKRFGYAHYGVREYWRFDHTGGQYHDVSLAGDHLVNDDYEPISLADDLPGKLYGMLSGYSDALGLYLCWDAGSLRFYNPQTDAFLMTREEAESALAEVQAERDAALERIRQLEAELGQ
ncbi:MAG: Uma2 family endonuclease [Chloroflexota bacterium]|nr:Uma2 family endonuclease [Chloroflexota bacterium]